MVMNHRYRWWLWSFGAKRIKKVKLNESEGEIREGLQREMKENQY